MTFDIALLHTLRLPDFLALFLLFAGWFGIGWLTEHPPAGTPSVSELMKRFRREWMRQFVARDNRIVDSNILASLRQGTSFFASACMIATGGLLALIGNGERLRGIVQELEMQDAANAGWELRLLVTMFFVANAFLQFVWSHRLFGYCAVTMAAVPNKANDPAAMERAMQAADLNITAARSFNAGLRSVYFALGSLGWLAGAWGLMIGAGVVLFVTWRREFNSNSRRVLMRALPAPVLSDPTIRQVQAQHPPQP
ncbi:DUF599 domain-containing protein [Paracoccus sp. (in: a-proteobacteria)]|uniref:DUF599 domain-containing protein n=1 Tax=Paracoccus sp. TaxID=267 RepID=UPI0026DEAFE9|nr:DUF599 domain-containing protein [Paracoccus sp. (in: a-proteobacteria)]MDO5646680.1 DUF599 domain-containing protein [Paracoccus sp. (in: a-proteobacteria)]